MWCTKQQLTQRIESVQFHDASPLYRLLISPVLPPSVILIEFFKYIFAAYWSVLNSLVSTYWRLIITGLLYGIFIINQNQIELIVTYAIIHSTTSSEFIIYSLLCNPSLALRAVSSYCTWGATPILSQSVGQGVTQRNIFLMVGEAEASERHAKMGRTCKLHPNILNLQWCTLIKASNSGWKWFFSC